MKKLKATVTKKDGTNKEVYVVVDEQTAEMLTKLQDKQLVNDYLVEEYKMFMSDRHEHLYTQSLDKSLDGGLDIVDEKQDLFALIAQTDEYERVHKAIAKLEPQQQWLVYQVYFEGRTQSEIAREIGVDSGSVRHRMQRIREKLKKFLS